MRSIKFDVFGRRVLAVRSETGWQLFYLGADGKRRPATDIVVPGDVRESDLDQYLGDLCHEWATEHNPTVERLA
jgi:hypothetical protein